MYLYLFKHWIWKIMSSENQWNRELRVEWSANSHIFHLVSVCPGGLDKDVMSEIYNHRTQNQFLWVCFSFSVFIYALLCTVIDTFPGNKWKHWPTASDPGFTSNYRVTQKSAAVQQMQRSTRRQHSLIQLLGAYTKTHTHAGEKKDISHSQIRP